MYPHERSLVMKFKDRPFVLLGVDADRERETLRHAIDRQRLLWRCWWDGERGTIFQRWGVNCMPTVYVLDGTGVVRYRFGAGCGEQLEAAIETLLREVETQQARS